MALMKRCNMIEDCDDGSDEKQCSNIELDLQRYRKDDPPIVDGNKIVVNISMLTRKFLFAILTFEFTALAHKVALRGTNR